MIDNNLDHNGFFIWKKSCLYVKETAQKSNDSTQHAEYSMLKPSLPEGKYLYWIRILSFLQQAFYLTVELMDSIANIKDLYNITEDTVA